MASSSSITLSPNHEEEDLLHRNKKKVQSWEAQDRGSSKDDTTGLLDPPQTLTETYKEKLLNIFGEAVPKKYDFKNLAQPSSAVASGEGSGTGLVIPLSDEEWQRWSQLWQRCLITKVLGKNVSFRALESFLQRRWIRNATIKIADMADGFFLVYFSLVDDYNHALFGGPWMMQDHSSCTDGDHFFSKMQKFPAISLCGYTFRNYQLNSTTRIFCSYMCGIGSVQAPGFSS